MNTYKGVCGWVTVLCVSASECTVCVPTRSSVAMEEDMIMYSFVIRDSYLG